MSSYCQWCTKRWSQCHCGDWKRVLAFGEDVGGNPTWDAYQNRGERRPSTVAETCVRTQAQLERQELRAARRNGPVVVRRAARPGIRVG